jgi:hypothetical protein
LSLFIVIYIILDFSIFSTSPPPPVIRPVRALPTSGVRTVRVSSRSAIFRPRRDGKQHNTVLIYRREIARETAATITITRYPSYYLRIFTYLPIATVVQPGHHNHAALLLLLYYTSRYHFAMLSAADSRTTPRVTVVYPNGRLVLV